MKQSINGQNLAKAKLNYYQITSKVILHLLYSSLQARMFRTVGYFAGIVLFLVLGIEQVPPTIYYLLCAAISFFVIVLLVVFRLLANKFNGFWKVWSKRFQRWISIALMCLGRYTDMPQYEIRSITVDNYGNRKIEKSTKNNTLIWGFMEMTLCLILTGVSPLLLAFIVFCYGEAIREQRRFTKSEEARISQREQQIIRNSAKMDLMQTQNIYDRNKRKELGSSTTSAKKYPFIDLNIRKNAISLDENYPNQLNIPKEKVVCSIELQTKKPFIKNQQPTSPPPETPTPISGQKLSNFSIKSQKLPTNIEGVVEAHQNQQESEQSYRIVITVNQQESKPERTVTIVGPQNLLHHDKHNDEL